MVLVLQSLHQAVLFPYSHLSPEGDTREFTAKTLKEVSLSLSPVSLIKYEDETVMEELFFKSDKDIYFQARYYYYINEEHIVPFPGELKCYL